MPRKSVEHFDDDVVIGQDRLLQTELLHQLDRRAEVETAALDAELAQRSDQISALEKVRELEREERALYLTVLHSLAKAQGYQTKSPLESERYARLVFSRIPHVCAFQLSKVELASLINLTCSMARFEPGAVYFDPVSQQSYASNSSVVMCQYSGLLHRCVSTLFCDKTATAPSLNPGAAAESILHEMVVHRLFAVNQLACEENWPVDDLTEVDSIYSGLLFGRVQNTHLCQLSPEGTAGRVVCRLFHLPGGWNYPDPFADGDRRLLSSGMLEICMESGHMRLNLLGDKLFYCKTPSAMRDRVQRHFRSEYRSQDHGYICLLTSQFKASIKDQTPTTGKDEKVSLDRLSRWKSAQKELEEAHYDEDASARDSVHAELEREALADAAAEKELDPIKAARRYGKAMEAEANNQERVEKDEDEEAEEEEGKKNKRKKPEAAMPPPAHIPTARPAESTGIRKNNAALVAEGPGADEINGRRARMIAVLISSNRSRFLLYTNLLQTAARKAHERLNQVQRQSRYAALPWSEQYRTWLATVVKEMPIPLAVELPEIPLERYISVILRCWNFIVQTPFVVDSESNKRTQLTFTKMVISSLYFIAEGGYDVNCGFDKVEQREMEAAIQLLPPGSHEKLKLRVEIYPPGRLLAPYMADKSFLTHLSGLLGARIRFDDGIIGRGRELLDSCYNSLICVKKRQVINELKLCPTSKEVGACLFSYFQYCNSLRCWEPRAETPAAPLVRPQGS